MSASGDLNPKTIRVIRRTLAFTDSGCGGWTGRARSRPGSTGVRDDVLCSFTNAGIRHLQVQLPHRSKASVVSSCDRHHL